MRDARSRRPHCCPRTRADYARSIDCTQFTFPSLRRHCNFDVSEFARADGLTYSWTFDRDSGALVHADVIGDFACGSGFSTGRPWPSCDRNEQTCGLCEGGTERAAQCPADVVAVIPNVDCPPSTISACFCGGGTTLPGSTLPDNGRLCAPACDDCEDSTCFSSCICSSDGQFRQRLQCTE